MKRPAFQFYPADWRKDAALQSCSVAAQGLWINILCIAHECDPYGHMTVNGKPMTPAQIGRLVGLSPKECEKLLAELQDAGVSSVAEDGAVFSRRMVRDEDVRNRRAAGGKEGAEHGAKGAAHGAKGGRPKHEEGGQENPPSDEARGVSEPPSKPPPSSSSSSSTSVNRELHLTVESPPPPGGDREPGIDLLGHDLNGHAPKTVPDCPHAEVLALWAEVMPELPQHDPSMWADSVRADHLRARWRATAALKGWASKDEGLAYFRRLFRWCRKSKFLMGEAQSQGRRPFEFELAWLVNATNWIKVHEGKFHG